MVEYPQRSGIRAYLTEYLHPPEGVNTPSTALPSTVILQLDLSSGGVVATEHSARSEERRMSAARIAE